MKEKLQGDLKAAMKGGEKLRLMTVRGILSEVTRLEKDVCREANEDEIIQIIKRERARRDESLEFARRGGEDLDLFKEFNAPFELGVGVIDVKNDDIETPEMVAEHIRKALTVMPAEKIAVLTDCGCFHLPRDIAFAKLKAMVEGTKIVRKELGK